LKFNVKVTMIAVPRKNFGAAANHTVHTKTFAPSGWNFQMIRVKVIGNVILDVAMEACVPIGSSALMRVKWIKIALIIPHLFRLSNLAAAIIDVLLKAFVGVWKNWMTTVMPIQNANLDIVKRINARFLQIILLMMSLIFWSKLLGLLWLSL